MKPTEHQLAVLETYPPTSMFAVVSWGCAGTAWIARMLNSHPDIFCVHAANTFWHVLGGATPLDGIEYLRLIGSQGHAHRLAGDVHGVSRSEIPALRHEFKDKFAAAVVVRDPWPRLRSQLAHLERMKAHFVCNEAHARLLCDRAGLDRAVADDALLRKLHSINMLNAIAEERAVGPIFRLEDLAASPESIREFVRVLSRGDLTCSDQWLNQAINAPRVNTHVNELRPPFTIEDIGLIHRVVTEESWSIYQDLGYAKCQRPSDCSKSSADKHLSA